MDRLSPEQAEAATRYMLEATLVAVAPLMRALDAVDDVSLGEQPVPEQLPLGKLIEHAVGAVAFTSRAIRLGRCEESDVADLMTDTDATGTRPRIREVEELARAETRAALEVLTPDRATSPISYWFGWEMTGLETAGLGYQELCHHRGQVQSYLRLLGLEPPDVYESAKEASPGGDGA